MTYQELPQIIELINASSRFTAFHLKCGEIEVDIRRAAQGTAAPLAPVAHEPVAVSTQGLSHLCQRLRMRLLCLTCQASTP